MPRVRFSSNEERLEYFRKRAALWRKKRKEAGLPPIRRTDAGKVSAAQKNKERMKDPEYRKKQAEKVARYRDRLRAKGVKPHKPYTDEQKAAKRAYVKERRAHLKSITPPADAAKLARRKASRVRALDKWRTENPEKARESRLKSCAKHRATPRGKINNSVRAIFNDAIRCNYGKSKYTDILGYTWGDLRAHLESLFTDGMTWALYIEGQIHLDHIKPLKLFHYESVDDPAFKEAWALSNLQPLWRIDNLRKSDSYNS
jgi:hypothetical protein